MSFPWTSSRGKSNSFDQVLSNSFPDFEHWKRHFRFETHALPLAMGSACSAISMAVSMQAFQRVAMIARISSASNFGPVLGLGSTMMASVCAGQAMLFAADFSLSRRGGKVHGFKTPFSEGLVSDGLYRISGNDSSSYSSYSGSSNNSTRRRRKTRKKGTMETAWDEDETVFDAALGSLLFFFASRGSFSKAMPSDVAKIGANAVKSIKANGSNYANEAQKAVLQKFMRQYGCHHCGKKTLKVIGDHMPPNKVAFGSAANAAASRGANVSLYQKFFNFIRFVPKQRFWPQCESCSVLQSVAVRDGVQKLITHSGHVKIALGIGLLIGLRHFYPLEDDISLLDNAGGSSSSSSSSSGGTSSRKIKVL